MNTNRRHLLAVLLGFLIIEITVCVCYRGPRPVLASVADADPMSPVFSAERALRIHQQIFPNVPHAFGSPENEAVRERLIQLLKEHGWLVESPVSDRLESDGRVLRNVIARRAEHDHLATTPLVLCSHYDSCRFGPGAGDAGSCVAAIVEASRALVTSSIELKRPVWLLLTDGEESGLYGAQAFVNSHPLSKQNPYVLNFDARGSSGPVVMYETHPGNATAVSAWVAEMASPRITGSHFAAIYRNMPNGSDFSVFQDAGWRGFNFAIIDGAHRYHQPDDTLENLDPRSVQHFGEHALRLAAFIGGTSDDLPQTTGDSVFFDVLGFFVIHYPVSWCLPLGIASLVFSVQTNRRRLSACGMWKVLLAVWATVILILIAGAGLGWLLSMSMRDTPLLPRRFVSHGHWLSLGMWFAAMIGAVSIGQRFLRRFGSEQIWAATSTGGGLASLAFSILLPEFSHLVLVPVCIAGLVSNTCSNVQTRSAIGVFGTAILLIPVQHLLSIALGPTAGIALCPVFALTALPMLPMFGKTDYSITEK